MSVYKGDGTMRRHKESWARFTKALFEFSLDLPKDIGRGVLAYKHGAHDAHGIRSWSRDRS